MGLLSTSNNNCILMLRKNHPVPLLNDNLDRKILLVLGAQRAGTTHLASLLGAHPDIAIAVEDSTLSFLNITGKKIIGTKLIVPNQIQLNRSIRLFGKKDLKLNISKAVISKLHKWQLLMRLPQCPLSIEDYLAYPKTKVIFIKRLKTENIRSMMVRSGWDENFCKWCYDTANKTLTTLNTLYVNRTFVVEYEQICRKDNRCITTLKLLCDFIGTSFDKKMLEGFCRNVFYSPITSEKSLPEPQ